MYSQVANREDLIIQFGSKQALRNSLKHLSCHIQKEMDLLFFTYCFTGKSQGPAGMGFSVVSIGVTPARLPFLRISKEMSMWPSPPDPRELGRG